VQVSIVIPVYNALDLAQLCLASIFEHGAEKSFEVVVVDNGSRPDVEQWLTAEERLHTGLRHLRFDQPLGFARAANTGVAETTGEVVILLNSDTIVTPGWLDSLCDELSADPSLGALTPLTNHAGEAAQIDLTTFDLSAPRALALIAKRPKQPRILYLPQRVAFFCVALRREVWLQCNGLDEAYAVGNFEDDDLCLRLRIAGYRLGVAQHIFVYHHNNETFRANRIDLRSTLSRNAAIFASRARAASEAEPPATPHQPRRSAADISVVILPRDPGASPSPAALDRSLRSLANQTVINLEVIAPGSAQAPTRSWIAYLTEGDILYPFHLETLWDAMERSGSNSIFADGWVAGANELQPHPDAVKLVRIGPRMLSGWMHHASLDPARIFEQSVPQHWPRITWEMQEAPVLPERPPAERSQGLIEAARRLYRKAVPMTTRLELDAAVRRLIRRPAQRPDDQRFRAIAAQIEALLSDGVDAGKFADRLAAGSAQPAVMLGNSVAWNSVTQRQHHFARGLAQRGHPVFWLEPALSPLERWWSGRPLTEVAPNIHLVRLPGSAREIYYLAWSDPIVEAMTAAMLQTASAYGVRQVVSLINYPLWQPLAKRLRERAGWKIAADCLDDQQAFANLLSTAGALYEDKLTAQADVIFTSSVLLQERMRPRESILLHNGCDFSLFSSAASRGHLSHLQRPIIGFFGSLADWLDSGLIRAAALQFPEWSFVFIGPHLFSNTEAEVKWLQAAALPNITVIPALEPRPLAEHLAEFDVAIMPFLDIPVTRAMNAVKLYEYLAAGKPCVSRDLPEVRSLTARDPSASDLIALYRTPSQFFIRLREAVAANPPELVRRRQSFAQRNDWSGRIDVLSAKLIELAQQTSSISPSSSGANTFSQQ
jgi:GT2 family glycosyltransferase/glycosyltransferase involved in cell wall biosynthesis